MEELKICYKKINNLMKEIENRHDVSIDDFINLDDDIKSEYMGDWTEQDVDEKRLNNIIDDILYDFDENTGIGRKGYDELSNLEDDLFEFVYNLGKKKTGILEIYMLAFKLAKEQIDKQLK